jgi:hypothetical protein
MQKSTAAAASAPDPDRVPSSASHATPAFAPPAAKAGVGCASEHPMMTARHPDVSMISDHGDIGMCFSGG